MRRASRFAIPTSLPSRCPLVQKTRHTCKACWSSVLGKDYDFVNELCISCSKALVHTPLETDRGPHAV